MTRSQVRGRAFDGTPIHDVYWGSHGCNLEPLHEGYCDCGHCECADHERDHEANGCVSRFPYYGPETYFYGEDAEAYVAEIGYGRLYPEDDAP